MITENGNRLVEAWEIEFVSLRLHREWVKRGSVVAAIQRNGDAVDAFRELGLKAGSVDIKFVSSITGIPRSRAMQLLHRYKGSDLKVARCIAVEEKKIKCNIH